MRIGVGEELQHGAQGQLDSVELVGLVDGEGPIVEKAEAKKKSERDGKKRRQEESCHDVTSGCRSVATGGLV